MSREERAQEYRQDHCPTCGSALDAVFTQSEPVEISPEVKLALGVVLNHVQPGWQNCATVVREWLMRVTMTVVLLCLASVAHAQGVIRIATEAECPVAKHQCLYTQRLNPQTGAVLARGSITKSGMGHQTAPQIIALSDTVSRLVTVSDGAGKYGGIMVYGDLTGGWPLTLSSPFLLDLDPAADWNHDPGMGRRMAVLWRQLRHNDDKLNAANEPWRMVLRQFDLLRVGSAAPTLVVLSDTPLTDWSTQPGYRYGYPTNSRWNTALVYIPLGGWAVGFQSDGDYVVGVVSETGVLLRRSSVSPAIDYAGDVAVSRDGQRIGYVTTRRTDAGVELVVGER